MWRPCSGWRILKAPRPRASARITGVEASNVRGIPVTLRNASTARCVRAS